VVENRANRVHRLSQAGKFDRLSENRYNEQEEVRISKKDVELILRHLKGITIHFIGFQKAIENLLSGKSS